MPQIHLPTMREIRLGLAAGDEQNAFDNLSALRKNGPVTPGDIRALCENSAPAARHFALARQAADDFAGHPVPALPFAYYRLFEEDGNRTKYEDVYFKEYAKRINVTALSWMSTGEESYKRDLENTLWALCDAYTWSLPAHLWGDSLAVRNDPLYAEQRDLYVSRPYENPCQVDLFASMTAQDVTEILYLFGEQLAPVVVRRLRNELKRRIFDPILTLNKSFIWEEMENNWSAVCAGSVGCALIYSVRDSALLAPILTRMCQALEPYFYGFTQDGICEEGLSYWVYGFRHFVMFAELLRRRTAGKVDLFGEQLVRNISCFPQKGMLNGDVPVSFSDCSEALHFDGGLLHYLHKRVPEASLPDDGCISNILTDHISYSLWTVEQFDPALLGSTGFGPFSTVYPEAEWLVTRCLAGGRKIGFAAKGGNNMVSHNHNDAGCFIYEQDGEQLICDAGAGAYTRQYFDGSLRYGLIACGSHGHSVPIIGGKTQLAGSQYRAQDTVITTGEKADSLSCDIACAYGSPEIQKARRELTLQKDTGVLTLRDSFTQTAPAPVVERFTSWQQPVYEDGCWVIRGKNGSGIRLRCLISATVSSVPFPLHDNDSDRPLWLLDYTLEPAQSHDFTLTAEPII